MKDQMPQFVRDREALAIARPAGAGDDYGMAPSNPAKTVEPIVGNICGNHTDTVRLKRVDEI